MKTTINTFRPTRFRAIFTLIVLMLVSGLATGQETEEAAPQGNGPSEEELKKANNPLADVIALNVQYYFRPNLNGVENGQANTLWTRFAAPTGPILWRVSVPIETRIVKDGENGISKSGLGDIDIFAAYMAVSNPKTTIGIGPSASFDTASDVALGSGKNTLGVAAVGFHAPSKDFQFGGLVTWKGDVGGDPTRDDVNLLAIQPFYFWQLGKGFYFRGAPIIPFDLDKGDYHVPVGLGIGKVVKMHNTVFNFFIEPQPSVLIHGAGQPTFQFYGALNMQF